MLRKISHIMFAVLLLFATTGVAISQHYCGGSLISTSIFNVADPCCSDDDCCKNESHFYQLDNEFSTVGSVEIPHSVTTDIFDFGLLVFDYYSLNTVTNSNNFICLDSPPPPKIQTVLSKKQTYLL